MNTIVVVCSSGLGTSLMIRMNLVSLLQEYGIAAHIEQCDSSSVNMYDAELVVGARQVVEALALRPGLRTIALDSITDKEHLRQRLASNGWLDRRAGKDVIEE